MNSQVAFSAALVESDAWTVLGPFEADHTLKFERVVTNVGNGYDHQTGTTHLVRQKVIRLKKTSVDLPWGCSLVVSAAIL